MKKMIVVSMLMVLGLAGLAMAAPIATVNVTAMITTYGSGELKSGLTPMHNAAIEVLVKNLRGKEIVVGTGKTPLGYPTGVSTGPGTGKASVVINTWPGTLAPFKARATLGTIRVVFNWRGSQKWEYRLINYPLNAITTVNINLKENSKWEPMGCNKL